jgi:hypothetical protein
MRAAWINLGSTLTMVDESGAHRGTIITMDKQTHQRSLRALYEPPVSFTIEDYSLLHKRLIDRKTA